ncbi:Alpha/Beta hydrolase protein [Schizophyllum fasciatum]
MPLPLTPKTFTTSRGIKYAYAHTAPRSGKPTLLFLHGFPSTAHDWRHQVAHFAARGYGVVVPDMLGYGGTDKPADPAAYVGVLQARDLAELVDHAGAGEAEQRVIVVAHDWGTMPSTYLAVLYPDRFAGFVNVALGIFLARNLELGQLLAAMKESGSEIFGYWVFFNKDDTAGVIENNLDSLFDMAFPKDPALWQTTSNKLGGVDPILMNGVRFETADFVTEEDRNIYLDAFAKNGLTGPLNWYKMACRGLQTKDGLDLSLDNIRIKKPFLYIGGSKDYVCRPELQEGDLRKACEDLQTAVFDAGHWTQLEVPELFNEAVEKWMENKGLVASE